MINNSSDTSWKRRHKKPKFRTGARVHLGRSTPSSNHRLLSRLPLLYQTPEKGNTYIGGENRQDLIAAEVSYRYYRLGRESPPKGFPSPSNSPRIAQNRNPNTTWSAAKEEKNTELIFHGRVKRGKPSIDYYYHLGREKLGLMLRLRSWTRRSPSLKL